MASLANTASSEVNSTESTAVAAPRVGTSSRTLLIVGGALGVVGAVLATIANGLHPHTSDFQLNALLQELAQSPTWDIVHLTLILALVLIFGALLALTLSVEGEPAATVARLACLATLLGGALILVSTAIDGFAMSQLARAWYNAAPAEKATALQIAGAIENAQYAVYSLSVAVFLGLGIFLYGLATLLSRAYPKALGWLALFAGGGALVVGVAQTLGGPAFRDTEVFFVLCSMLSTVWVFVMGVLMWRQARRTPDREVRT